MYKIININKKDYKLEYSLEASLYPDSTEKLLELISSTDAENENDKIKNIIKDDLSEYLWKKMKRNPVILPIIIEAQM